MKKEKTIIEYERCEDERRADELLNRLFQLNNLRLGLLRHTTDVPISGTLNLYLAHRIAGEPGLPSSDCRGGTFIDREDDEFDEFIRLAIRIAEKRVVRYRQELKELNARFVK